jgi:hypothetical protein
MSDKEKVEREAGLEGAGESGGGAYPNPHTGKQSGKIDGFQGHGGQSDMEYHGTGRLGGDEAGGNSNAPAKGVKPDPR